MITKHSMCVEHLAHPPPKNVSSLCTNPSLSSWCFMLSPLPSQLLPQHQSPLPCLSIFLYPSEATSQHWISACIPEHLHAVNQPSLSTALITNPTSAPCVCRTPVQYLHDPLDVLPYPFAIMSPRPLLYKHRYPSFWSCFFQTCLGKSSVRSTGRTPPCYHHNHDFPCTVLMLLLCCRPLLAVPFTQLTTVRLSPPASSVGVSSLRLTSQTSRRQFSRFLPISSLRLCLCLRLLQVRHR